MPAPPKFKASVGALGLGLGWVLPPLSNSWIMSIIQLYIALSRTPNIDCYWGVLLRAMGLVLRVWGFSFKQI